jgi:hypothetical protein
MAPQCRIPAPRERERRPPGQGISRDGGGRRAAVPALKVSPVLGFLGAGVLLGPYGLGALAREIGWLAPFALDNVEQIAPVAEFGIVFLLFMLNCRGSVWRLSAGSSSGSAPPPRLAPWP